MMTKTIYSKYDKGLIGDLPVAEFGGRIVVVLNASEAERAVRFLLAQPLLGLDTETRPSFKRGDMHKVALLQVATPDVCFLFRLNHTGMTDAIRRLLEDTEVTKVGLSWHDDLNSLHHLGDFRTGRFLDIQDMVRRIGIEDMSLQKIYANLFGQKISKRQQLTNWEADVLSDRQKAYAATDARHALSDSSSYELIKTEEPQHETGTTEKR